MLLSLTAVSLMQESIFRSTFVECSCSAAMMTCNLDCDMALQYSIGYVQIAVCTLHYALLHRITVDLQFVLCKLHVSVLHCGTDYFQFGLCKLCHKTMQCSTGNLQFVVCQMCYVVQQCSCGEFQFALCKLLHVLTTIQTGELHLQCARYMMWYYCVVSVTRIFYCAR